VKEAAPGISAPMKLHCLGGVSAPIEIVGDLRKLLDLPPLARQTLWDVLGPCLGAQIPPSAEARLTEFCRVHDANEGALAAAIKACRFLLRSAVSLDLSRAVFAEDLASLAGSNKEISEILLAGYDSAKALIRAEILQGALADHGKLCEAIDWRVDYLASSNRGEKLRIPVAMLTLRYREGSRSDRITLQFLPDAIKDLRKICDQILS
jgi:COMM domain